MKIAIMQPYIFPYIGYFQLIKAVDKFIILDDVNYINKGWINRNKLLINGQPAYVTIPLVKASQNRLIKDLEVSPEKRWKKKILKTIEHSYSKSSYYPKIFPLINEVITENTLNISHLVYLSLVHLLDYLCIQTKIVHSSTIYANQHLKAQDKILDICKQEQADQYINPIGGSGLYDHKAFEERGIELSFINPGFTPYNQGSEKFIPGLSIIDILMNTPPSETHELLENYSIEHLATNYS